MCDGDEDYGSFMALFAIKPELIKRKWLKGSDIFIIILNLFNTISNSLLYMDKGSMLNLIAALCCGLLIFFKVWEVLSRKIDYKTMDIEDEIRINSRIK